MYELMNNHDLNMYYGGTYMRHDNSIVYVENISGERSSAVAITNQGEIRLSALEVYYPDTCVLELGNNKVHMLESDSSRSYKKSFRTQGGGSPRTFCEALTAKINRPLPSLEEAAHTLSQEIKGEKVFGMSGKFWLKKRSDYSVLLVYYMSNFIGYYDGHQIVVHSSVSSNMMERLSKNAGGVNVNVEP